MIGRVWTRLKRTPWSAHLLRANDRYNNRLGNQLAGGITYFSVLTLVPVLMLIFSALGFLLTVIRPDWLLQVRDVAIDTVGSAAGGAKAVDLIQSALANWRGVGLVALVSAAYAGSGWMGNLRGAVRAQWRPDFDWSPPGRFFLIERLVNLGYFVILLGMVTLSFLLTTVGSRFGDWLVGLVGLTGNPGAAIALQLGTSALAVVAGFALFYFLFEVLPQYEAPRAAMVKGSLMAAISLAGLQYLTALLIAQFSRSFAALVFGNIIIVMLFFNLFARLTLFAAAWIATSYQPAFPRKYNETDELLRGKPGVVTVPGHWTAADLDRERILNRRTRALAPHMDAATPGPASPVLPEAEDSMATPTEVIQYEEELGPDTRPALIRRRSQVRYRRPPTR
ncbi:MAG TPA: YhjD/YihY/BrkB family envelope integrity protein [Propionibacteriaceae bacterium]|nr:YhjD/YihY/BrkB family envelope integrity protein [Propionibacteriaceae bacterium]